MIKHTTLKPIVINKEKFNQDINNWTLIEHGFGGLDYDNDEWCNNYEFDTIWKVGDDFFYVSVEVAHRWVEDYDSGDYWTPPSYEIVHEDIDLYINQICTEDGEIIDMDEMKGLVTELEKELILML